MKLNYKKLAFVALDIVVLGFFGLYLALNVKYRDDIKTADFRVQRLLDNTSGNTPTPKPKPACTSLSHQQQLCFVQAVISGDYAVWNDHNSKPSQLRFCWSTKFKGASVNTAINSFGRRTQG